MVVEIAAATTSFLIAFLIVPVIIEYSLTRNLVDIPGRRKIHKKVTPSMGGIAIFFGFFISSLIWIDIQGWGYIKFILVALFVIFFIGVRDDLVPLKVVVKLMGQLMAASLVIFLFDLRIKTFYGLFGVHELPAIVSYATTYFTLIVVTNSFNLIDGLDGLAGTIAILALLAFGVWFFLVDDQIFSVLSFAMLGAIFAFLIFNWEPSKVFMGDTGALVIGMMLGILAIHFINVNYALQAGVPYKFNGSVGTAVCIIIIPLVDTLRIVILRISRRQSPFKPDKSHVHHSIMRLGLSHGRTTLVLAAVQILYIGLAVAFNNFGDVYVLSGALVLSFLLSLVLDWLIRGKLSD